MGCFQELERNERRSITMSNSLWNELIDVTNNCMSVSQYVRQAIFDKLRKDFPHRKGYFDALQRGDVENLRGFTFKRL